MAAAEQTQQTLGFQAEAKQLLQLMIHSLYSNREIFLRELISNASMQSTSCVSRLENAACLKTKARQNPRVQVDEEAKTITISDNGVGMSRARRRFPIWHHREVGHRRVPEESIGDRKKDAALIGQFGVGFYSAFIVARESKF
jgi:molecular chaperone HtpG